MAETIKTVEGFIDWTNRQEGGSSVYRGIPNAAWEVESAAYRRIRQSQKTAPPLSVLQNYIRRLLKSARRRRFQEHEGKGLTNLELLADLQHYGAATCLIDFTSNALTALWFACRDEDRRRPGKVVAMADAPGRFSLVDPADFPEDPTGFLSEDKLWKWKPIHLNIRIVTQQSVFIFGPRKIDEKDYESVVIDEGSKRKIRGELARRFDIREQYLFRDFPGFVISNAHDRTYHDHTKEDYFSLGLAAEQQGADEEAKEFYVQVLELDPQHTEARKNLETVEKRLAQVKARHEARMQGIPQLAAQGLAGQEAMKKLTPLLRRETLNAEEEETVKELVAQVKAGQEAMKELGEIASVDKERMEIAAMAKARQISSKKRI